MRILATALAVTPYACGCSASSDQTSNSHVIDTMTGSQDGQGSSQASDVGQASLLGVWFLCEDKDCNNVTYEGWRFQSDRDFGKFALRCKNAGPMDLSCECWEGDVKKTTFNVAKICKDITLEGSVPIANSGCGWNIFIP